MSCLCEQLDGIRGKGNRFDREYGQITEDEGWEDYETDPLTNGYAVEMGTPLTAQYRSARWQGPYDWGNPLTGGYVSPLTLQRTSAMPVPGPNDFLRPSTHHVIPPSNPIGPTDRMTPQYPALHLARGIQIVDRCTPVTEWQHNYGYLEIEDTQGIPLEGPRYSYAAMDANDLLDEARARVIGTLYR